jgi:hypothetical protein
MVKKNKDNSFRNAIIIAAIGVMFKHYFRKTCCAVLLTTCCAVLLTIIAFVWVMMFAYITLVPCGWGL